MCVLDLYVETKLYGLIVKITRYKNEENSFV